MQQVNSGWPKKHQGEGPQPGSLKAYSVAETQGTLETAPWISLNLLIFGHLQHLLDSPGETRSVAMLNLLLKHNICGGSFSSRTGTDCRCAYIFPHVTGIRNNTPFSRVNSSKSHSPPTLHQSMYGWGWSWKQHETDYSLHSYWLQQPFEIYCLLTSKIQCPKYEMKSKCL